MSEPPAAGYKHQWLKQFRGSRLPPSAFAVGLILCTYASGDGGDAWAGLSRLCRDTGMTRETVIEALRHLVKAGLIQKVPSSRPRGAADGRRGPLAHTYQLTIARNWSDHPTRNTENRSGDPTRNTEKLVGSAGGNWSAEPTPPEPPTSTKDKDLPNPTDSAEGDPMPRRKAAEQTGPALVPVAEITGTIVPASALTPAQSLVAEWLEHRPERPPQRIVGQVSKHIKRLLDEGIAYEHVRAGLAAWHLKGDQHPATIDSFVSAAQLGAVNGRRPGQMTADERDQRGAALAEHYRQLEAQEGVT